jgi:hypothetical protein
MTSYELYSTVATFISTSWVQTPLFMNGEVITDPLPYVSLDIYPLGGDTEYSDMNIIHGVRILCYDTHRGRVHKLMSDVVEHFSGVIANGVQLEKVRTEGAIIRLDSGIYEGVVKFNIRD